MPTVDVIVPTRNRPVLTAEAVHSVCGQTHADWRLFVVDDESEPEMYDELLQLLPEDERIHVVRRTSRGGAQAARETGWEMSTAPLVALLDSDDLWAPEKLERQLQVMDAGTQAGVPEVVLCWHQWVGRDEDARARRPKIRSSSTILITTNMSTPLIRRDTLLRVGGFLPEGVRSLQMSEGIEFHLRLAPATSFSIVEDVLVTCRHHLGNRKSDRFDSRRGAEDLHYALRLHEDTLRRYPWDRALLMSKLAGRYMGAGAFGRAFALYLKALASVRPKEALKLVRRFAPGLAETMAHRIRALGS